MPEPIRYRLRFPDRAHHYLEVEGRFPAAGRSELELVMAVWTPGSYLVREFAKHVEALCAAAPDGAPLAVVKSAKNRWRVTTSGAAEAVVRYRLYARDLSVRGNFVDAEFALVNGAATFLAPADGPARPFEVCVERPDDWERLVVARPACGSDPDSYLATDFDELADSPLWVGSAPVHRFEVDGREHLLVNQGEDGEIWDGARAAADVERIVRAEAELWGELPYRRYVFFNLITEAGGGLEHRDSTVLMTSRWKARTRAGWLDWLSLVAHELFHVWNVKRLRPVELGPFDYEREVHTRSLWIAEGITSYYDDLVPRRAGGATDEEYRELLSKQIEAVESAPGRLVQPLAEASFDAWIKFYRRDENWRNTTVSYYAKGAAVAFLLDAELRRATGGSASLDHLLREAYRRFSGARGFREEEFRALASDLAGRDLAGFFRRAVDGTEELDYEPALDWFGLRFRAAGAPEPGAEPPRRGWLGATIEETRGRLLVTEVLRETPAFRAGLAVDDELLAIGGFRVAPAQWPGRLESFPPGSRAILTVARRERLIELPVEFAEEPDPRRWRLELDPGAGREAAERRRAWLGPAEATAVERAP